MDTGLNLEFERMHSSVIRLPEMGFSHEKEFDFLFGMESSNAHPPNQVVLCGVYKEGILRRLLGYQTELIRSLVYDL